MDIEKGSGNEDEQGHGNVMQQRYKAMKMKMRLRYKGNNASWITVEALQEFAGEGRFWSEQIFDAILFLARECRATLGSYLRGGSIDLKHTYEVADVVDVCERCLERLRPEVFFSEETGMIQPYLIITLL